MTPAPAPARKSASASPGRQKLLAAILGILLLVLAIQRFAPLLVPRDRVAEAAAAARRAQLITTVEELRLADLERPASRYSGGRNPFRFGVPPPPPGPTAEELAAAARRREEDAALRRSLEAQRLAELARPRPPAFSLKYLGNFGPDRRRIAVFSDSQSIYNALEGDVLEGRFLVFRIGLESVDIKFIGFPDAPPLRVAIGQ